MTSFKHLCIVVALLCAHVFAMAQRILYIGDSVTDGGWGRSGGSMLAPEKRNHTDLNHLYGHSYMMLCASELESRHPQRHYVMMNRGVSGDDMERLTARWQHDAIDTAPDVLSLLEGTNDVLYYLDSVAAGQTSAPFNIMAWERRYRDLLDRSRRANPQLRIVLGTPFVAKVGRIGGRDDWRQRDSLIAEMAGRIRVMAKEYNATLVDYHALFAGLCKGKEGAAHWIWDGIHPTPAGHRRMADLWLKRMKGI